MRSLVPENHTQWSNWIHGIRHLTPDRATFAFSARYLDAKPEGMVSSLMVKQFLAFRPDFCQPSGVMY